MTFLPSLKIDPMEGRYAGIPHPKKERDASVRMLEEKTATAWLESSAMICGI